jgi:K+-sensing histidine kinase KdpD
MLQSPDLTIKDKQTIRFSVMPLINKSIDFIAELRALVDLRRMVKQPKQLYLLEDVLDEVLLFFHDHQHRITISEVEDLNILTHQDAVYLLVKNLVSNAIKYSPGGEPVQVNVFRDGSTLRVECLDQGIGISKDKRKAIYEPYKRFAGEYKNINGQGIGLAIVRFIVHTYQGEISITDNQPQGSRFVVRLKGVVADE